MPVTARLSKLFYERLGEQIANELVDWFNAVDATYRSDLREMNEVNFARFEAKLEHELQLLRNELQMVRSEVRAEFRADMKSLEARLVKWMFLFWSGTTLAGLLFR